MKVFIVILHFGSTEITDTCLNSILKSKSSFEELIVVDNSGNFEREDKRVTVIKNKRNLGFAGGVNVGIKYALSKKADYVMLLNNDTNIVGNFLESLIDVADRNIQVGIVGPAIKFKRDGKTIYDLGGKINRFFGRTTHNEDYKISNKNPRAVDYVSGCAMLIKRDVFRDIGLFDDRFFLYYEDVDFCLRAKNKNFMTYILPTVYIEHELSKSVGKVSSLAVYHQTKSAFLFGKKYFRRTLFFNRVFIFAQSLYILIKNPKAGIAAIKAFKYI